MSNTTDSLAVNSASIGLLIIAYYTLVLMIVGTLLNLLTFLILCRATFRDVKARPTLHYMRAIAIFDILMLYVWNLDHYMFATKTTTILYYSVATCKLLVFISFCTSQISAWLRVFICFDRFLSFRCHYQTWFHRSRNVLLIIGSIILLVFLLNLHLLIFCCYRDVDGSINPNAKLYTIYPWWDYVNLAVYNCCPFIVMMILNACVIYYLVQLRQKASNAHSQLQHGTITLTLLITTTLFVCMTTPATIAFAVSPKTDGHLLHALDAILATYHASSFPLYIITFREFRREFLKIFTRQSN
jgi:hypothetical protein